MVVIPRYTFNTPGSIALNERLKEDAGGLADGAGATTGVTGGAAELIDYTDTISERIPIMIAVITIATFLILVVILRAIPLAAIAVALNLVTVARRLRRPDPALRGTRRAGRWAGGPTSTRSARRGSSASSSASRSTTRSSC